MASKLTAVSTIALPALRKDFIIDPWQIDESRCLGADCILLIVAALEQKLLADLLAQAKGLGMDVLVEVHDEGELQRALLLDHDLIGVNNRNLKTFEVSLQTSRDLVNRIPDTVGRVSESGLGSPGQLRELKALGYHGFLMGESFMKEANPGAALAALLTEMDA